MRTIVTFITILFCSSNLLAQTNYYTETKVINEADYAYHCKHTSIGYILLHDKENKLTYNDLKYKDSGERYIPEDNEMDLLTDNGWIEFRKVFYAIMQRAFSEYEKTLLKINHQDLYIDFYIDTETGKVHEIAFSFPKNSGYAFIPISVYRNIELQIKDKCRFGITEDGKRLNYIYYWDTYKFE